MVYVLSCESKLSHFYERSRLSANLFKLILLLLFFVDAFLFYHDKFMLKFLIKSTNEKMNFKYN